MSAKTPRRGIVAIVAVLSLVGAVAVVRGASAWAATNAPLTVKPVDAQTLSASLQDEQARSAALRDQLDTVAAQAADLAAALKAAQDKASADADTASQLAAKLKAAEAKLAALQARATPQTVTQVVTQTAAPGATATPGTWGDDGHEGGGGDD